MADKMAIKKQTEPVRARWDGDERYLIKQLELADGTLSAALEPGSVWTFDKLPPDLAYNPNMIILDGTGKPLEGEALEAVNTKLEELMQPEPPQPESLPVVEATTVVAQPDPVLKVGE